jgi:hypothetical protein
LLDVIRRAFDHLWTASPPLTALTLLMLATLVGNVAGLAMDPRMINGESAWLKPAKFALSTALYAASIAFVFRYLRDWPRLRAWTGGVMTVSLTLELGLINLQAFRGIASHFNVSTPGELAIFNMMGGFIACVWIASLLVTIALFRQRFEDAAFGWALRFGLAITVAGAGLGGLMLGPTPAQSQELHAGHKISIAGAHTVGAPDGGPGYPLMHWSREHGDLRVPHFVGLHALQTLPLLYLLIKRVSSSAGTRTALTLIASAGYAATVGLLLWQALLGKPLLGPW